MVDFFQTAREKNKKSYLEAVSIYKEKEMNRRGHVEFIYSALKYMKEFGVERDLEVYKALIDVLPKGRLIPKNIFQIEFMHYPKQQQCAIDLLEQMEENGVIPDWNMEDQLINVFGKKGFPLRRYWRMMYWMPKFRNLSPWPLPHDLPNDTYLLAILAIQRITSVDIYMEISEHKTSEVEDFVDDTWIISAQSFIQRDILASLPDSTPVYIEGGFRIWLKNKAVTYFILRINAPENYDINNLDIGHFAGVNPCTKQQKRTVHEQADGTILAVCITGTSSKNSLLSWVRILQLTNPKLAHLSVVFPMKSPIGEVMPPEQIEDNKKSISDEKS
ncbi:hypothetical protein AAG570_011977 [Ranatra chinensis]|uniref:Evolutionarily conserved signaling intermediate in Toll pathway, mitochondrial n=1 Tax=Ranatra chinensis TaxID=642074 RepID=A0ABD0YHG7_9HEMI